ncbi:hypothetical protein BS78_09G243100 [Paspalum vaginatum]|nr:hypothetical protein BS78_09G243100 [Paspalum vaginatum]KAJ1264179.1 hypothetical protein BS78_09G243100 [Paspalum vaginatum]KAJ1264182.1 hypothetical protein BS78_09G243100 [Paspalum vaginatum]
MSEAEGAGGGGAKEQDRFLPIANIGRIMRRAVPDNGKIAKDAKDSVQECVSEFISFITSEASDKCMKEKRKTINGDDLIWSLGTLGFEEYVEPLKLYLKLYREVSCSNLVLFPPRSCLPCTVVCVMCATSTAQFWCSGCMT